MAASIVRILIYFELASLIFLARISVHFGTKQLPVVYPITLLIMLIMVSVGALCVSKKKLLTYVFAMLALAVAAMFNVDRVDISLSSLLGLSLIYFMWTFTIKGEYAFLFDGTMRVFQKLTLVIAFFCIAQFVFQQVGSGFFDLSNIVPANWLLSGFNTTYRPPLMNIYKSNGFFMPEPSFASQLLACALIYEYMYFKRVSYMLIYLVALVFTFSGTGILLLVLSTLFLYRSIIRSINVKYVLAFIVFTLPLIIMYLPVYLERAQHQISTGSSAYARWISPFVAVLHLFPGYIIFGAGPGSESRSSILGSLPPATSFTVVPSVLFQYGLVGALLFFMFLYMCFKVTIRNGVPINVLFPLLVIYFLLSGALVEPFIDFLVLFLALIWRRNRLEASIIDRVSL